MDSQTQQFAARWGIIGPLILQGLAMIGLAAIVITHDGDSVQLVINAFLVLIGSNAVAGGGVAVVHAIKSAAAPAPASPAPAPQVIPLPTQPSMVIPAPVAPTPAPAPAPIPAAVGPAPVATGL